MGGPPDCEREADAAYIDERLVSLVMQEIKALLVEQEKELLVVDARIIDYFFCALPDYPEQVL